MRNQLLEIENVNRGITLSGYQAKNTAYPYIPLSKNTNHTPIYLYTNEGNIIPLYNPILKNALLLSMQTLYLPIPLYPYFLFSSSSQKIKFNTSLGV